MLSALGVSDMNTPKNLTEERLEDIMDTALCVWE